MKEKVLQAMREFGAPVNAGKIAEITCIDRKEVDKAFAELKKRGCDSIARPLQMGTCKVISQHQRFCHWLYYDNDALRSDELSSHIIKKSSVSLVIWRIFRLFEAETAIMVTLPEICLPHLCPTSLTFALSI